MAKKNVHVVKHENGWAVKKEGAKRSSAVTPTQAEAIQKGRQIAQNERSELIVHGRGGKIRQKDSYGSDPYPPRG